MSVELATAYVSIVPSASGITKSLHDELDGPIEGEGKRSGNALSGALTGAASKGLKVGAGAVAAGFGVSLVKGFGRLRAIDDARFKLQGLGHDASTVDAIMDDALAAVLGTSFGLGEAATIAASAVAAGIQPGEDLERTLSLTGDAAAIAGTSLDEMGQIFNVVAANNRLSGIELRRLGQRGIPVLQWLQDEYGVTGAEAAEMVSRGEVDFATFQKLMEDNIGGAAKTAGESFSGAFANMGAAMGRFGAALLGPAFAAAPAIFGDITAALDRLTPAAEAVGTFMADNAATIAVAAGVVAVALAPIFAGVIAGWTVSAIRAVWAGGVHVVQSWRVVGGFVAQGAAALAQLPFAIRYYTTLAAQAIRGAATHVAQAARVVGGWVLMGVQSLIQAGRMAVAWVIAMGPIGWVIAAVVGLTVLIVKNWDTVVKWTRKAWTWVTGSVGKAWTWIRGAVSKAVAAVVGFVVRLRDRAVSNFNTLRDRIVGAVDTARNIVMSVFTAIRNAVTSAVVAARTAAVNAFNVLRNAITTAINAVRTRVTAVFTGIRTIMSSAATAARTLVTSAFNRLRTSVVSTIVQLLARVRRIPADVRSALGNVGRMLFASGRKIILGLRDGIVNAFSSVRDAVSGGLKTVRNLLPFSPAKEGPFSGRGWTLYSGRSISEDLAKGIGQRMRLVTAATHDLAARAQAEMRPLLDAQPAVPAVAAVRAATFDAAGAGQSQGELVDAIWRLLARQPDIVLDDGALVGRMQDRIAMGGSV